MMVMLNALPFLWQGLLVTLQVSAVVVAVSLVLGVLLGTALTYMPIAIMGLFLGGLRAKQALIVLALGGLMMPLAWHKLKPYQKERLVSFMAPEGFALDNTTQAVLGTKEGAGQALRLDVVKVPAEQSLIEYINSGWIENIENGSVEELTVNSVPAATATAIGPFRNSRCCLRICCLCQRWWPARTGSRPESASARAATASR